jgi:hypothetical protein
MLPRFSTEGTNTTALPAIKRAGVSNDSTEKWIP